MPVDSSRTPQTGLQVCILIRRKARFVLNILELSDAMDNAGYSYSFVDVERATYVQLIRQLSQCTILAGETAIPEVAASCRLAAIVFSLELCCPHENPGV